MSKNDGGPAFPQTKDSWLSEGVRDDPRPVPDGMSLRDYFAAKAMEGWIASFPKDAEFKDGMEPRIAKFAYMVADAMLAEREK